MTSAGKKISFALFFLCLAPIIIFTHFQSCIFLFNRNLHADNFELGANMRFYVKLAAISALLVLSAGKMKSEEITEKFIIEKYGPIAEKITKAVLDDTLAFKRLAFICDRFGPRLSGSEGLEQSIDWAESEMKKDGLANVRKEEVHTPHWVRGEESCEMLAPRKARLTILGLGGSIATPPEGITSEILVVESFDELARRKDEARGKIVVFDVPFNNYGQAVPYRFTGASAAARYGAAAVLVRSVSPFGMNNAHTGMMKYSDTLPRIPAAAISIEDAGLLHRLTESGFSPKINLKMSAQTLPDCLTYNLMGELPGREKKDEIIALGGHIDSWDVGTGAHDDASGCVADWTAVKILKDLGLVPRRTLRSVFWANEENGVRGGNAYYDNHKNERHALVFEWDCGVFPPSKIGFTGPDSLFEVMKKFAPLYEKIGKISVEKGGGGVDIGPMMRRGSVAGMSLGTDDRGKYFWYHHSAADTIDKIDKDDFARCIAAIAVTLYVYADLPVELANYNK